MVHGNGPEEMGPSMTSPAIWRSRPAGSISNFFRSPFCFELFQFDLATPVAPRVGGHGRYQSNGHIPDPRAKPAPMGGVQIDGIESLPQPHRPLAPLSCNSAARLLKKTGPRRPSPVRETANRQRARSPAISAAERVGTVGWFRGTGRAQTVEEVASSLRVGRASP